MRKDDPKLEANIEKDHVNHARAYQAICIKGELPGITGWPDQLVLKKKGFYWVEFKLPHNSLQDDQVEMHELLRSRGHTVYTCDSYADSNNILRIEFN